MNEKKLINKNQGEWKKASPIPTLISGFIGTVRMLRNFNIESSNPSLLSKDFVQQKNKNKL
jgi:hypothetical protein